MFFLVLGYQIQPAKTANYLLDSRRCLFSASLTDTCRTHSSHPTKSLRRQPLRVHKVQPLHKQQKQNLSLRSQTDFCRKIPTNLHVLSRRFSTKTNPCGSQGISWLSWRLGPWYNLVATPLNPEKSPYGYGTSTCPTGFSGAHDCRTSHPGWVWAKGTSHHFWHLFFWEGKTHVIVCSKSTQTQDFYSWFR